ncbi:EAL domain-containing protein [Fusibacter bizertensis]
MKKKNGEKIIKRSMIVKQKKVMFIILLFVFIAIFFIEKGSVFASNLTYTSSPKIQYQVDENYPPYTYSNQQFLYGFDIELTNLIFKLNDYQLVYSTDNWTNVYQRIKDREIDLAGIIAVTEERKKEILFSKSLFNTYVSIYSLSDFRKIELEDLKDLKVGVGKSYYTEELLRDNLHIDNYIPFEDMEDAIDTLKMGKIDVIFENQQLMDDLLIKVGEKGMVVPQVTNLFPVAYAYGISKDKPELVKYLNRRIDELNKNGIFEEVYVKYFYQHSEKYIANEQKKLLMIVLIPIMLMSGILLALKFYIDNLRKRTFSKEVVLSNENEILIDSNEKLLQQYEEINSQYEEITAQYEEIQVNNETIYQLAYYDQLTGLPNRSLLSEHIESLISPDLSGKKQFSYAYAYYIEIDNFKAINDILGHNYGDYVLKFIGNIFMDTFGKNAFISRVGGDEFFIIIRGIKTKADATVFAEKIGGLFNKIWSIGEHEIYLSASIGVVSLDQDCLSSMDVYMLADAAMYRVKSKGGGGFKFYESNMMANVIKRSALERDLRNAIVRNEFYLEYQPIFDAKTESVIGLEALIRWYSPEKGIIAPGEFIPLTEEIGLIVPIGEWVISEVCRQIKEWQLSDYVTVPVTINIAEIQLESKGFLNTIAKYIKHYDIDPYLLHIELTESNIMHNISRNERMLRMIKLMGLTVLLDDFGTGYSSLSYLQRLPVDVIKIDKSFVNEIKSRLSEQLIISDIISIAHRLNKTVIAEGVETIEQLNYLKQFECDAIQGFYFSKPIRADEVVKYLDKNS